jgi:hypothetical protein
MNLKDGAIYRLPYGRELVSCLTCDTETLLSVSVSEHGLYDDHSLYELNSEGRLLVDDRLTAWQIDDLLETGRVAGREIPSILLKLSTTRRATTNEQST